MEIKRFNAFNENISFNDKFIIKSIENIEKELEFATEELDRISKENPETSKLTNTQLDDIVLYYKSNVENLQKTLDNLYKIKDLTKDFEKNGEQYLF